MGGRLLDLVVQTRAHSVICACHDLVEANSRTGDAGSRWSRAEEVIPRSISSSLRHCTIWLHVKINSMARIPYGIIQLQASSTLSRFP